MEKSPVPQYCKPPCPPREKTTAHICVNTIHMDFYFKQCGREIDHGSYLKEYLKNGLKSENDSYRLAAYRKIKIITIML